MRLVLMGPPGAGKGTQASAIAEHYRIPAISTGDIFRHHISSGTELGRQVQAITATGRYVPDEVTNAVVEERLSRPDAADGFLLDGYPRTVGQVAYLDELLGRRGLRLDAALELVVDEDHLVERLLHRADEQGRADDTEEVIRKRMAIYHKETEALTDHYARAGLLRRIDGIGAVDEVRERISAALEAVPD